MDRRTFLTTTAAAAASGTVPPAAAAPDASLDERAGRPPPGAGEPLPELRLASAWAPDVPVLGPAAREAAGRLAAAFAGRYSIEVEYPRGPEIAPGDADVVLVAAEALAAPAPAMAYFAGLRGSRALAPLELHGWLTVGGGQLLWDEAAAGMGWKPLLAGHTGRAGLWTSRPLSAADLAGAALAIGPLGARVAAALGMEPRQPAPHEARDALAAGRLAAVEWGNPLAGLALGLAHAATHFYPAGLDGAGTAVVLAVRRPLWDRLGGSERAIFEAVAAQAWALALAESVGHARLVDDILHALPNLEVAELPGGIVSAWADAADASAAGMATDREARRIRDSYHAWHRRLADGSPRPGLASV